MAKSRPITDSLPDDQKKLAQATAELLKKPWYKEWGPIVGLILGLIGIYTVLAEWGDGRWMPVATAKEKHSAMETVAKDARQALRDEFGAKQSAMQKALSDEISLRQLQGKDVESNARDTKSLDRRVWRLERGR